METDKHFKGELCDEEGALFAFRANGFCSCGVGPDCRFSGRMHARVCVRRRFYRAKNAWSEWGFPEVGRDYVFFLSRDATGRFLSILTAYGSGSDGFTVPLDSNGTARFGLREASSFPFERMRGIEIGEFLDRVDEAIDSGRPAGQCGFAAGSRLWMNIHSSAF